MFVENTGANIHVKPDLEVMDNSEAYYGDNALHVGNGVANALATRYADRNRNGEDSHDSGMGGRRQAPPAREYTYQDFMKCNPIYFKGTEGVVELTQWFKRMKTVFRISNCTMENQIKFATCTLLGSALTWWNSHVMTFGLDVTYTMTWINLRKKMTDKYCPRSEIKMMFPKESNKIKRYIGGLPDMIYRSVMAFKPKTMQDVIEFTTELMDKKISTFAECQTKNKRKQVDNHSKKTRGKTLAGPTLLDLRKRSHMGDLSYCVLNATITLMVCVLPNATSETELAIWSVTVGALLLLTIRETSLAMNVGIKGTTRANAQS
nr:hypothetical protein [Tanacetum cinerariifolium]